VDLKKKIEKKLKKNNPKTDQLKLITFDIISGMSAEGNFLSPRGISGHVIKIFFRGSFFILRGRNSQMEINARGEQI